MADPARAAAQRYCGWHVSPEDTTRVVCDGPGGPLLALPTLNLRTVVSVTEDGIEVDVSTLEWSANGMVRKKSRENWTSTLGGISVRMVHGFDEADDFEQAVALIAAGFSNTIRDDAALTSKKVGDVEYQWSVTLSGIGAATALLDQFRLPGAP